MSALTDGTTVLSGDDAALAARSDALAASDSRRASVDRRRFELLASGARER
jgi:hypothetical protein